MLSRHFLHLASRPNIIWPATARVFFRLEGSDASAMSTKKSKRERPEGTCTRQAKALACSRPALRRHRHLRYLAAAERFLSHRNLIAPQMMAEQRETDGSFPAITLHVPLPSRYPMVLNGI